MQHPGVGDHAARRRRRAHVGIPQSPPRVRAQFPRRRRRTFERTAWLRSQTDLPARRLHRRGHRRRHAHVVRRGRHHELIRVQVVLVAELDEREGGAVRSHCGVEPIHGLVAPVEEEIRLPNHLLHADLRVELAVDALGRERPLRALRGLFTQGLARTVAGASVGAVVHASTVCRQPARLQALADLRLVQQHTVFPVPKAGSSPAGESARF